MCNRNNNCPPPQVVTIPVPDHSSNVLTYGQVKFIVEKYTNRVDFGTYKTDSGERSLRDLSLDILSQIKKCCNNNNAGSSSSNDSKCAKDVEKFMKDHKMDKIAYILETYTNAYIMGEAKQIKELIKGIKTGSSGMTIDQSNVLTRVFNNTNGIATRASDIQDTLKGLTADIRGLKTDFKNCKTQLDRIEAQNLETKLDDDQIKKDIKTLLGIVRNIQNTQSENDDSQVRADLFGLRDILNQGIAALRGLLTQILNRVNFIIREMGYTYRE